MKLLQRTFLWSIAALVILLAVTAQRESEADPISDFSFGIPAAYVTPRYIERSQIHVADVFRRRLDSKPTPAQARALAKTLIRLCRQYRFEPALILSFINIESGFRTQVVSSAGAVGLMQLMPPTAKLVAHRSKIPYSGPRALRNPATNLTLGIAYLAFLRDKYEGLPAFYYIAAYLVGPHRLDQLVAKKFKPIQTKAYFEKIKRGVPSWRYYAPAERRV